MGTSTFSGPLRVGSSDGVNGTVTVARNISIAATAVANTDFTIQMPDEYQLLRITNYNTTTYTGTTVTLSVGTTAGGAEIVNAHNIKPAGVHTTTFVTTFNPTDVTNRTLYLRIAQTGATAVGASVVTFEYAPLAG